MWWVLLLINSQCYKGIVILSFKDSALPLITTTHSSHALFNLFHGVMVTKMREVPLLFSLAFRQDKYILIL